MKKKNIILLIIIIVFIVGIILFSTICKNKIEINTKNIIITKKEESNTIKDEHNEEDNYTESDIVNYFKNLDAELSVYNNDKSIGETIKYKFVKCIDFIFYDKEIGGKTFKELTNTAKLKILSIMLSIDSKIENKFPGYKEKIDNTYQNIKNKIVEKYLDTTSTVCENDQKLCTIAKEEFNTMKETFGITWDVIKNLTTQGTTKLKEWYEVWKNN